MGNTSLENVADDELDRQVADLILQEAKQKEAKYGTVGIGAYLPATLCASLHHLEYDSTCLQIILLAQKIVCRSRTNASYLP